MKTFVIDHASYNNGRLLTLNQKLNTTVIRFKDLQEWFDPYLESFQNGIPDASGNRLEINWCINNTSHNVIIDHKRLDLVFIHLGNREGEPDDVIISWNDETITVNRFSFYAFAVLSIGGRVVFFSGDKHQQKYSAIAITLKDFGFSEGKDFIFRSESFIDFHFSPPMNLQITPALNVSDFFSEEDFSLIIAIQLLIMSFLIKAVTLPEQKSADNKEHEVGVKGNESNKLNRSIDYRYLIPGLYGEVKNEDTARNDYWFKSLFEIVQNTTTQQFLTKYGLQKYPYTVKLWRYLRYGLCAETHASIDPIPKDIAEWQEFQLNIKKELDEYLGQFEKTTKAEEYEQLRARLNHKRIKNDFLLFIGENSEDITEKSKFIFSYLRNIEKKEANTSMVKVVEDALSEWPKIRSELIDFLEFIPSRLGLTISKEYEVLKKHIILDEDGPLATIDEFVSNINQLVSEKDCEQKLREFWEAGDQLYNLIAGLKTTGIPNRYLS